jgi:hypothetical protein
MQQLCIDFETASKINREKLSSQNKIIFEYLEKGNNINTVIARNKFQVFNLHSRISDLRNKAGIIIYDRMISIGDMNCKEYSLKQFA